MFRDKDDSLQSAEEYQRDIADIYALIYLDRTDDAMYAAQKLITQEQADRAVNAFLEKE